MFVCSLLQILSDLYSEIHSHSSMTLRSLRISQQYVWIHIFIYMILRRLRGRFNQRRYATGVSITHIKISTRCQVKAIDNRVVNLSVMKMQCHQSHSRSATQNKHTPCLTSSITSMVCNIGMILRAVIMYWRGCRREAS